MHPTVATQFTADHGKLLLAVALDPKEVGRRIKAARERHGWTQLELATEHAHVSPSTVARWESGKLPPVRELMRIADVLEVSAESLVEPEPSDEDETNRRLDQLEATAAETRAILVDVARALGVAVPPEPFQDEEPAI